MNCGSSRKIFSPQKDTKAHSETKAFHGLLCLFAASPYVFAALCLLLLTSSAFAQQRPLITEDPRIIPNGAFVLESGFGYAHRARFPLSGASGDEFSLFTNGLNFSLGPRAEFQINGTIQNF